MNQLHLHLYDDELCGIRFEDLPFGWDNEYSISISDLRELVTYAADYDVEIVPEVEGWAHVTSIVYHRPELRGGDGMFNGSSFLIGPDAFALMKEITRQVVSAMPLKATIHFGLDEAKWFPSPEMPEGYSPQDLVRSYYDMLQELAEESGKELAMRIWADHGGRPVSDDIKHNVIIEPWQYWNGNIGLIEKQIENYSGEEKMRFMMGAGQSMAQHRGAYHATRYWCKHAVDSPNVDGVNITFWGRNDLVENLVTLFAGAYFAWNPNSPVEWTSTEDYEEFDRYVFPAMQWWQTNFRDAFPDDMRNDSAPFVYNGFRMWGENHGKPVAPTAVAADTLGEHDFLQES
jgi:N-acetyl-beta-hexosaminidase